jgi:hypothetical protein
MSDYRGDQVVEKSGGAPVEDNPAITPDEALRPDREDTAERRPDSDQAGHEPHEHAAG